MTNKTLLIATKNSGKAEEFKALFKSRGYEIKTLLDFPELEDVEETGTTFEENALLKAETISKVLNQLVIADDSGLRVNALGGMPGVYSARYAGEQKNDASNNAKLLADLGEEDSSDRSASFHCALAAAHPEKESLVVYGQVDGLIAEFPTGEHGFGYDPLFYIEDLGKTMAELSQEQKNNISHRANALAKLDKVFDDWIGEV